MIVQFVNNCRFFLLSLRIASIAISYYHLGNYLSSHHKEHFFWYYLSNYDWKKIVPIFSVEAFLCMYVCIDT